MFIKSKENKSLVSTYPEEGYSRNIKLACPRHTK
jgi:hypothetical protein